MVLFQSSALLSYTLNSIDTFELLCCHPCALQPHDIISLSSPYHCFNDPTCLPWPSDIIFLILASSLCQESTYIPWYSSPYFVLDIMISMCAHVPTSPRARTSVPDQWSGNKGTKKEWIWVNDSADWDCWMASYTDLWFVGCLARQSRSVI